jgi:hypothetical protein
LTVPAIAVVPEDRYCFFVVRWAMNSAVASTCLLGFASQVLLKIVRNR